jgi:PAS domain-containing protein
MTSSTMRRLAVTNILRRLRHQATPSRIRVVACGLAFTIAVIDWLRLFHYSIGLLYAGPIMLLASVSHPLVIALAAIACAVLREAHAPFAGDPGWPMRLLLTSTGFILAGLAVAESVSRRVLQKRFSVLEHEHTHYRDATRDYLQAIINTTPLALITLHKDGRVLLANTRAHQMLGFDPTSITSETVADTFPTLAKELKKGGGVRLILESFQMTVTRAGGLHLRCRAWACWHMTASGGVALTCVFADDSDEVRNRELQNVEWLTKTSGFLITAAMHEVRNVASAAAITLESMLKNADIENSSEAYTAIALIRRVQALASHGLLVESQEAVRASVALRKVLDDIQIIAEPVCSAHRIELLWDVPAALPVVRGDPQSFCRYCSMSYATVFARSLALPSGRY